MFRWMIALFKTKCGSCHHAEQSRVGCSCAAVSLQQFLALPGCCSPMHGAPRMKPHGAWGGSEQSQAGDLDGVSAGNLACSQGNTPIGVGFLSSSPHTPACSQLCLRRRVRGREDGWWENDTQRLACCFT